MNKIQRRALSIKKVFGCSQANADAFALDVEKAESEPNGRIGNFEEISENVLAGKIGDDLSEQVRARAKAKAGIKSFKELANDDWIKAKIKYQGGIRI